MAKASRLGKFFTSAPGPMSIKVEFSDGVFKPLEKVDNVPVGAVYTVLSEGELRSLTEDLQWLKASEKSFEFWDNPEDAVYDTL